MSGDLFSGSTMQPAEALERLTAAVDGTDAAMWVEVLAVERLDLLKVSAAAVECRRAQDRYFRHRDNLPECMHLERKLDKALAQL